MMFPADYALYTKARKTSPWYLAIPLIAGPGAISLVIIDSHQAAHWVDRIILSSGIVAVAFAVWISLRLAMPIGETLGGCRTYGIVARESPVRGRFFAILRRIAGLICFDLQVTVP